MSPQGIAACCLATQSARFGRAIFVSCESLQFGAAICNRDFCCSLKVAVSDPKGMRDNQRNCFDIDGTRATITQAAPESVTAMYLAAITTWLESGDRPTLIRKDHPYLAEIYEKSSREVLGRGALSHIGK